MKNIFYRQPSNLRCNFNQNQTQMATSQKCDNTKVENPIRGTGAQAGGRLVFVPQR